MKIDWFRTMILGSLILLMVNIYFLYTTREAYPVAAVDLSPYTGATEFEATIFNLRGDDLVETTLNLKAAKRERFQAIMDAYSRSTLGKVESLRVNKVYEENSRIYLDVGRNSFSHPGVAADNIARHVQAIVNSLTSVDRTLPVQFLFNGKVLREEIQGVSFQQPFERNEINLGYHRGTIKELMSKFLQRLEEEKYAEVRPMLYVSPDDHVSEAQVSQSIRAYRQTKKDTIAREIEVFSEPGGYRIHVFTYIGGRPEVWQVIVVDQLHYIQYSGSPLVE